MPNLISSKDYEFHFFIENMSSIENDILGELRDIKGLLQQIANDTSRIS